MFAKCLKMFRGGFYNAFNQGRTMHTSMALKSIADGGAPTHKPTPFQRRILLWTKTYKTDADIPNRVTITQMKNSMDRFRIRVSIAMLAITFVGAGIMAMIGKKERREGNSVYKMAMKRREDYEKDHEKDHKKDH